jgi:hypothetical protein
LGVGYFGSFYILDNDRQIDFGVLLSGLNSACLRFCGVGGCCNFLRSATKDEAVRLTTLKDCRCIFGVLVVWMRGT